MNRKSIKFINNIALTLVLSMTVFVACQKEVGIVPDPLPAANSGLVNKEVAFNPGIYDQAAGDPLFTAYYEAFMQLKAPLVKKIGEQSMDKHLDLLGAAIENNNLGQVASLLGYESLDCYTAAVANVQAAASKLLQKYPSSIFENPGEMGNILGIYIENYQISSEMRLDISLGMGFVVTCGAECDPKRGEQPDERCCKRALRKYNRDVKVCAGVAIAASIACLATGPGAPACIAAIIVAEGVCIGAARGDAFDAIIACCKDAPEQPKDDSLSEEKP
ncbi:MAG TPA: hypothetical protein EYM84_05300 [Flavobacteriales bacterium]|nr:hypothetical protein [Flavobacteriales bacterium]